MQITTKTRAQQQRTYEFCLFNASPFFFSAFFINVEGKLKSQNSMRVKANFAIVVQGRKGKFPRKVLLSTCRVLLCCRHVHCLCVVLGEMKKKNKIKQKRKISSRNIIEASFINIKSSPTRASEFSIQKLFALLLLLLSSSLTLMR